MNPTTRKIFLLCTAVLTLAGCATQPPDDPGYGDTQFEVSGTAEARELFNRGLLMLHNFEYEDAREQFLAAQAEDPDMVMAYWGEALTYEHPLWGQHSVADSTAALARLAPTAQERLDRAVSDRERAYVAAVNALFASDDDVARKAAYSEAMRALAETWPGDADAAALYALSIMATSRGGRDTDKYLQAGAITEKILAEHPDHPGALHYNIHAYDTPEHATFGLAAADKYALVAPAAIHALHMPAHIYFALGMYDKASALNQRSWDAAVARMQAKQLPPNGQAYHSLAWLAYSLVQEGRVDEAFGKLDIVRDHLARSDNALTRSAFLSMRAQLVSDTGDWANPVMELEAGYVGLPAYVIAADRYVKGMRAIQDGDLARAEQLLRSFPPAGEEDNSNPRYGAPEVTRLMLESQVALAREEGERAIELLQLAVEREHAMSPDNGPAVPVKPAAELLGDTLMASGEYARAVAAYDQALTRRVARRQSADPREQAMARLALTTLYNRAEPFAGITTAGQPDAEHFKAMAALGYTTVIDMRTDSENRGLDEKAVVEELGMDYVLLPVSGREGINFDNARALDEILSARQGQKVLVHCGSSNRVGAIFALRASQAGESDEDALEKGRSAGLKSLESAVVERLEEKPQ